MTSADEAGIPVSVIVHTRDSADTLGSALESARWSSDVIVVDMMSEDATRDIAGGAGARIIDAPRQAWSDALRNTALAHAREPWTLVLDADERLGDDAHDALRDLLDAHGDTADAFRLARINTIAGHQMRGSGWAPDWQIRLFRSGTAVYAEEHHRPPTLSGAGRLRDADDGPIIHHANYSSVADVIVRQARYAASDSYGTDPADFDPGAAMQRAHEQLALRGEPGDDGDLSRALAVIMAWDEVMRTLIHWDSLQPRPALGTLLAMPIAIAEPPFTAREPDELTEQLQDALTAHADLAARHAELAARHAELHEELHRVAAELQRHATELDTLRSSTSWRITAPLRRVRGGAP